MTTKTQPSHKWGYCSQCAHEVKWVLGYHHSGERCYYCPSCHSWKAKPVQRNVAAQQMRSRSPSYAC